MKKDVFCCITSRGQNNSDGESNLRLSESTPQSDTEPQTLLTKAITRFMCHGRLFTLCCWIQSHLWVHKLHNTFPHLFSALFWNCSFSANMLVSHLAHINFTGFMRHLAISLSSDCFCEKTTMSKSICIILIQSGPIFEQFALEVYKLARMDGWDILRKQILTEVVDYEGEM